MGGKRHGQGAFFYANGDIYTGEWEAGLKHGQGTYFCKASGATLVGKYVNGNLTNGSFTDKFRQTYTGAFAGAASSVSYAGGDWALASGAMQPVLRPDWVSTFDGDAKAKLNKEEVLAGLLKVIPHTSEHAKYLIQFSLEQAWPEFDKDGIGTISKEDL